MSEPREEFEAYLENGQANTDTQGRYIGDPLDLWLAAWDAALSTQPQAPQGATTETPLTFEYVGDVVDAGFGLSFWKSFRGLPHGTKLYASIKNPSNFIAQQATHKVNENNSLAVKSSSQQAAPETPEGQK